jgi:hypothetical protein
MKARVAITRYAGLQLLGGTTACSRLVLLLKLRVTGVYLRVRNFCCDRWP